VVVFLMAGALLTTTAAGTTMVPAAYAGGDDNNDDNGDGNKQKTEDESAAAIADCDENDVEQAGFDCIAIAANDVEREPPEELATLSVCKSESFPDHSPEDFIFTVTGNNPSPAQFAGDENCVNVTIGPGEYTVSEVNTGPEPENYLTDVLGDCDHDPPGASSHRATGEIQAGETQECDFINFGAS
jgi:hypothetical protein